MTQDPSYTITGVRFFAALRSFVIECPRCGAVYGVGRGYKAAEVYNPRSQRFRCTDCSLSLVLGLIAYPVKSGHPARPEDTLPTPRQQGRLKGQMPRLLWAEGPKKGRREPVNALVATEQELDPGPAEPTGRPKGQVLVRQRRQYKAVEGGGKS